MGGAVVLAVVLPSSPGLVARLGMLHPAPPVQTENWAAGHHEARSCSWWDRQEPPKQLL